VEPLVSEEEDEEEEATAEVLAVELDPLRAAALTRFRVELEEAFEACGRE
jgi:hypothetical protein